MVSRKTLQIDEDLKNRFDKTRGKSANDKMALLLDVFKRKIAEEDTVYRLINVKMNDIQEILKTQNKEIESVKKEMNSFTSTATEFVEWVRKGGHKGNY